MYNNFSKGKAKNKKNRNKKIKNENKNEISNEISTQDIPRSQEKIGSSSNKNLEIKKKMKKIFVKKEDDYFGINFDKDLILKWNIDELTNEENNSNLILEIYKDFIEDPKSGKKYLLNVAACIGEIVGRFKVKRIVFKFIMK